MDAAHEMLLTARAENERLISDIERERAIATHEREQAEAHQRTAVEAAIEAAGLRAKVAALAANTVKKRGEYTRFLHVSRHSAHLWHQVGDGRGYP